MFIKLFSRLALCTVLSSLPLLTSCNSDSGEEEALVASPIYVTEVEFYAARFHFSFVTQSGQLVKITPQGGSGTGGLMPGTISVDNVTANVSLQYDLEGDFPLLGDVADPAYDATGVITVTFNDLTDTSVRFFEALGVTFQGAEEEGFALPANSGFMINVIYLNPSGSEQVAMAQATNPLGTQLASWQSAQGVDNINLAFRVWLETNFLQGAYRIERNY